MSSSKKKIKVIDRKASDNIYLHKDFHGALCYGIKYLDDNYGEQATKEYLQQTAKAVYSPLIDELKTKGLSALEKHFRNIFTKEDGKFSIAYKDGVLILKVARCPAIAHLKKIKQLFTERFCETTVVVNDTICRKSGFRCICVYKPGAGTCVQKFWKEKK
jgi:hypothetical protein